jgi:hypothetical protein
MLPFQHESRWTFQCHQGQAIAQILRNHAKYWREQGYPRMWNL